MKVFAHRFAPSLALALSFTLGASSLGCSDDPEAPATHAISAKLTFTRDADGQHVTFGTQNGSTVSLLASQLVGKMVYWVTTPGGEPATNATPIDAAASLIAADLTATFATAATYAPGPWELSAVVAVSGAAPPNIPASGDLAAFDNTPPPAGEPALTGVSVRVRIADSDASVALSNLHFIRFGAQ